MIKVSPLFSGSRGNCTLIQTQHTNILLDAGFGYKAIANALERKGLAPSDICGIVISHEHSDHIGALSQFCKLWSTPVYAPKPIADYLREKVHPSTVTAIDGRFILGDVTVDTYECSHDARCCFGYRFNSDNNYFACVTDTGCETDELVAFLSPCETVMLESNHDVDMLSRGDYPYPLKQRILSKFGHLSNAQAAAILKRLVGSSVRNVILAHLSEQNNTKELAFNSVVSMYAEMGVVEGKDITVYVCDQYKNEVTI